MLLELETSSLRELDELEAISSELEDSSTLLELSGSPELEISTELEDSGISS